MRWRVGVRLLVSGVAVVVSVGFCMTSAHASVGSPTANGLQAPPSIPGNAPAAQEPGEAYRRKRTQIFGRLQLDLNFVDDIAKCGLCVVDQDVTIVIASQRTQAMISAEQGIRQRSGRFHVERAHIDRTVHALVRRVVAHSAKPTADMSNTVNAIGVPDRDGRTHYALRIMPFECGGEQPLALITIVDLIGGACVERSAIAGIFGLTQRESELAKLFSDGHGIEKIAALMDVSPNTARVHMRHVLAKTGSSNQVQLARMVSLIP